MKKLLLMLTAALAGCSLLTDDNIVTTRIDSAEIFYSRASLTGTEFEHYKLASRIVFYECGSIHRGTASAVQHGVLTVPEEDYQRLIGKLADTTMDQAARGAVLPEEGDDSSFSDPGKFSMSISGATPVYIRRSFDSVSNKEGPSGENLFEIVRSLRSLPETPPCSNGYFFGIPSSKAVKLQPLSSS